MKISYLVIIAILALISSISIMTDAFAQNETSTNTNNVEIQNIQVEPSAIKVGDTFKITATLVNNSTNPIFLSYGVCEGKFSVIFDNHVAVDKKNVPCVLMAIEQRLDPGTKTTGTSPGSFPPHGTPTVTYTANAAGIANATVTFAYSDSGIEKTISKSFLFTINDNGTKIKTVNNTVLSPLKQLKSGIPISNIQCAQDLSLVIKSEDGSPACVKPDTAQKLMERGWTKNPTGISALAKPPIGIYNLTLSTNPIILGIPFYINAVVVNHQTEPITYYNGCISPLSVSFDSIKTSTDSVHCLAISKYTLEPNQSVSVQSDKIETLYNTTRPNATTNAQIKFIYETSGEQGSVVTSMQIPIQNAIMIDCSGELVMLHIAQIDKTVNVTKAIALAYTSPKFLSEIKQYGNLSYSGFYNDWFSSESCHTYWNSTEVMFAVNDGSSSTRNIQVTEDINQTKVLKVSDFVVTPTK